MGLSKQNKERRLEPMDGIVKTFNRRFSHSHGGIECDGGCNRNSSVKKDDRGKGKDGRRWIQIGAMRDKGDV